MKDGRIKTACETGSAVATRKRTREARPGGNGNGGGEGGAISPQEARLLLAALTSLRQGDSSVRLPADWDGMRGKLAETFNEVVELNERMAEELSRLRQKVGKEGKLKQRADMSDVRGFWRDQVHSVNALILSLIHI